MGCQVVLPQFKNGSNGMQSFKSCPLGGCLCPAGRLLADMLRMKYCNKMLVCMSLNGKTDIDYINLLTLIHSGWPSDITKYTRESAKYINSSV